MADTTDPNAPDEAVNFHLPGLLAQAVGAARAWPKMRIVGIIADEGTPEAKFLQSQGSELATGPDRSVSALLSRELAKDILLQLSPGQLEWLFDEGSGSNCRLPIIRSARHGIRIMATPYVLPN